MFEVKNMPAGSFPFRSSPILSKSSLVQVFMSGSVTPSLSSTALL